MTEHVHIAPHYARQGFHVQIGKYPSFKSIFPVLAIGINVSCFQDLKRPQAGQEGGVDKWQVPVV